MAVMTKKTKQVFHKELLFAGSGGQGMVLTGKMLATAALGEGYNTTYIPSYGAEVRGGTAHCHVKVSEKIIGSPIVEQADLVVAMNEPSYNKFFPLLKRGSTLVANATLVPKIGKHPGVNVVALELTKIASDMGSLRSANMLILGLAAGMLGFANREAVRNMIRETLGRKNPALLDANLKILDEGFRLADEAGRI